MNHDNPNAGPDPGFDRWMARVDDAVQALCGASVHDLPDCPFADWYADGWTPKEAARQALENADG
jgi:hypothetical protein